MHLLNIKFVLQDIFGFGFGFVSSHSCLWCGIPAEYVGFLGYSLNIYSTSEVLSSNVECCFGFSCDLTKVRTLLLLALLTLMLFHFLFQCLLLPCIVCIYEWESYLCEN